MPDEDPIESTAIGTLMPAEPADGPEIALVQNRLTVAAMALTTLFFSGSFSLSLFTSFQKGTDYRAEFAHIQTTLALGVITCLLTIAALLICQHQPLSASVWYRSRRLWFALGSVGLYLTLSQALSAGLTEIVYGVGIDDHGEADPARHPIAVALGIAATPVWLVLLFGAPLHLLACARRVFGPAERRALVSVYCVLLLGITVINAQMYRARGNEPATLRAFAVNFALQLVQPLTWFAPWEDENR